LKLIYDGGEMELNMKIFQVSVFVENKEGRLADITGVLAKNNINIRALSIADTTHFGILRLIVDDPYKAEKIFTENGFTVSLTNVIAIEVSDVPGGLSKALQILSDNGISVEYMYAFNSYIDGKAFVIIRVEEIEKTITILSKNGIKLLESTVIYQDGVKY
jgi:hypothetical protein